MALESSLSDRLIFSKMIKISPKTLSGFCFVKMVGSCRRARKNWPIPAPRKIDPESTTGRRAQSSEAFTEQHSCHVTSGGKQSHAFPQKTIKMN